MKIMTVTALWLLIFLNTVVGGEIMSRSSANLGMKKRIFSESDRGSRVSWCRLKFPVKGSSYRESAWDWHAHPSGDVKMIQVLRTYTDINLKLQWNVVDINDLQKMCAFPLIFMHGQRTVNLTRKMENNLKEYLLRGGFLLIDDCVYTHAQPDLFYISMKKKLHELFPTAEFKHLTPGHELFNCYFVLSHWPHMQGRNHGIEAVYYQHRLLALIYSSDLHCGWVDAGWFSFRKTQNAYRMGVNLYIYTMNN